MSSPSPQRPTLHVNISPSSRAENLYLKSPKRAQSDIITAGIQPQPNYDLTYQGGKTIPNLTFTNFYVGGDQAWQSSDRTHIDTALAAAMSDQGLNNVVQQYFANQTISSAFRPSTILAGPAPKTVSQSNAETMISSMHQNNQLQGYDYSQTIFNLILPSGTVLTDSMSGSLGKGVHIQAHRGEIESDVSSMQGLGGYHGSVQVGSDTVYYAIVAYAENLANGQQNGIVAFDAPWKNITAALYHELNEARTDPDVNGTPGWVSNPIADFNGQSVEVGDAPVFEAGKNLGLVFKEVPLANGSGTVPVQLLYSNAVHGPEGPVAQADPPASTAISTNNTSGPNPVIFILLAILIVAAIVAYFVFFKH